MSFKNQCCRDNLAGIADPTTGERYDCPLCPNRFIYDGATWRNVLELGQRKVDKLATIQQVNQVFSQRGLV